jgi:hypothetical protein
VVAAVVVEHPLAVVAAVVVVLEECLKEPQQ